MIEPADRWILTRLKDTIRSVDKNLSRYRFNDAAKDIYDFTWSSFCDWYIELIKPRLYGTDKGKKETAITTAVYVLRNILKLLHPYAPFISEEIWQSLKAADEPDIMVAPWPDAKDIATDAMAVKEMELLMQTITAIRTIRSEMKVPPAQKANVLIGGGTRAQRELLIEHRNDLQHLAKIRDLNISEIVEQPALSSSAVVRGIEIYVSLEGLIDINKERERLEKDIAAYEGRIRAASAKLGNPGFTARAPEQVVEHERKKLKDYQETLFVLKENYSKLLQHK
jgi:valyl-tRNA synthetase